MVLLSGGLDSTTVACEALAAGYDVRALSVNYGQRHSRETASARNVANRLGIPLQEVDARYYGRLASFSALTSAGEFSLPVDRPLEEMSRAAPITYVPLRNTFFLTLAAAALESWLLSLFERNEASPDSLDAVIFIGANTVDYSGYPDCRPEFFAAVERTLNLGSILGASYDLPIRIQAPILRMTKAEIVKRAEELEVPLALTWSCYGGGDLPCGSCDACALRAAGFAKAGVADPALQ